MKLLRVSVPLLAFTMVAALAACGGGGGGGSTPPVQNPGGGPPPATNPPATNPPATNPPATNPPATSPPSTPPPITTSGLIHAADGTNSGPIVNGTDNWQTPNDGDTAQGGNGTNTIDGLACSIGQEPPVSPVTYHVHAFLGIMVNGKEMALPDAIGMNNPDNNEPILAFSCAYNLHTHGSGGIVHVEDPNISGNWDVKPLPAPPAKYNLQAFTDLWGYPNMIGIGGGTGAPVIYVGTHITVNSNKEDVVDQYAPATGAPSTLLLSHHAAYWLIYGTPPATLPAVDFGISD